MSRAHAAIATLLTCLGAGLIASSTAPYWWLGVGLVVFVASLAAPKLYDASQTVRARLDRPYEVRGCGFTTGSVVRELAVVALLIGVATWLFGGEAIFERMANADHGSHFAQAFMIEELLLETGSVFGWSHDWFTGFPLGYLYPIGGSLWVIAVHAATLGLASASTAYGLAVFGFFVFYGYAVYQLGRAIGGTWVGIVAAVVAMCDPGAGRSGGWRWAIEVGVWPNSLATAFGIAGVASLRHLLQGAGPRAIAAFALCMGAALLTHPMMLFMFAPLAVVLAAAVLFEDQTRRAIATIRIVFAYILGGAIALFGLGPFITNSDWTTSEGAWWEPAWDLGVNVFNFELIAGWGPGFNALALVGALVVWSRGALVGRCAVGLVGLTLATMNASFIDTFHLQEWVSSLQNVQFLRASTLIRPFFAAFVAMLLVDVVRRAFVARLSVRSAALAGLAATLLAPIAAGVLAAAASWAPLPGIIPASEWEQPKDRAALAAYINDELPDEPFYRIAYLWGRGQTRHLAFWEAIDKPWFKSRGGTSAVVYKHRVSSSRPAVFELANVRYVVHDRALKDKRYKLVRKFGRLQLYEFVDWKRDPFTVQGKGEVKLLQLDRHRLRFEAGPGASGQLIVHVGNFSRWHATVDGKPVAISTQKMAADRQLGFMRIPLSPGTIEFEFRQSAADVACQLVGLLAVLICLMLFFGVPRRWVLRFGAWTAKIADSRLFAPRVVRIALVASAAVGALAFVVLPAMRPEAVVFDFTDVTRAEVELVQRSRVEKCTPFLDRYVCGEGPWGDVASRPSRLEAKSTRRCISSRPPASGKLRVRYADVPVGKRLVGHVGVPFPEKLPRGKSVRLTLLVDGKKVLERDVKRARRTYRFDVPTKPGTADVVFEISGEPVPTCFYAEAQ